MAPEKDEHLEWARAEYARRPPNDDVDLSDVLALSGAVEPSPGRSSSDGRSPARRALASTSRLEGISPEIRDILTLLTAAQVCELLQIKLDWLYDECHAGRFPHVKLARKFRFRPIDIQAYLEGTWTPPASPEASTRDASERPFSATATSRAPADRVNVRLEVVAPRRGARRPSLTRTGRTSRPGSD